jgi:hypothetical protein
MEMNARFFPRVVGILSAVCSLFGQEIPRNVFVARDLNPNESRPASQSWREKRINVEYYSKINPKRSLLLYDCADASHWCERKEFGFEKVFTQLARLENLEPNESVRLWYKSADKMESFRKQTSPWNGQSLTTNRFQLLAIVNRMDLAKWDEKTKMWTGAELRFVYGPARVPPAHIVQPLTLIAEFVMPPLNGRTFRALAQAWFDLSRATPDALVGGLKHVVDQCRIGESPLVRLRLNHETGTGPWEFAEWDFGPAKSRAAPCGEADTNRSLPGGLFEPWPLQDQITARATKEGTEEKSAYLELWARSESSVPNKAGITVPPCLRERGTVSYVKGARGMPIPTEVRNADLQTRNILSLQQCSFCHSSESGTKFMHISNRSPDQNSKLSGFLTGKSGNAERLPAIDELCSKPQASYAKPFRVKVHYTTTARGVGSKSERAKVIRCFNDLARRGLFLSAVLMAGDDPSERIQEINEFRTDFSH